VERIVRGRRGGICYHLDGAFGWLLSALGFEVGLHPAGTQSRWAPGPQEPNGTHVVLIVSGLPDASNPDGRGVADVGAGEGFCAPLPLAVGEYRQGDFTYRIRRSDLQAPRGDERWWRFDYDRKESCRGVEFAEHRVALADLHSTYTTLAGSDMSIFFRYGWVKRHTETGYDELIGCQLSEVTGAGRTSTTIESATDYFAALEALFGLTFDELGTTGRDELWQRISQAWTAEGFHAELPPSQSGAQR
jgi:N-hydroxyarylamine O-acetyltransferase